MNEKRKEKQSGLLLKKINDTFKNDSYRLVETFDTDKGLFITAESTIHPGRLVTAGKKTISESCFSKTSYERYDEIDVYVNEIKSILDEFNIEYVIVSVGAKQNDKWFLTKNEDPGKVNYDDSLTMICTTESNETVLREIAKRLKSINLCGISFVNASDEFILKNVDTMSYNTPWLVDKLRTEIKGSVKFFCLGNPGMRWEDEII